MTVDADKVADIIRETAAEEILPRFRALTPMEVQEKNPGDLVTAADQAAEQVLTRRLAELTPGALVVGEEAHESSPEPLKHLAASDQAWIIDPLDGTHNFAHGKDRFAVIVALAQRGKIVAGWIHVPIDGEIGIAELGSGLRINNRPVSRLTQKPVSHMTGSLGKNLAERLNRRRQTAKQSAEIPKKFVRYRCVGLEYLDLARGRLDFARYGGKLMPWDHAAGVLMHREAGGHSRFQPSGRDYALQREGDDNALLLAPDRTAWDTLALLTD